MDKKEKISIEQIDFKLKIIQETIDEIADKIYDIAPNIAKRLKVQILNIAFIRGDVEELKEIKQ